MKAISIINLKGGVAKTVTSINIAHILATLYGFRVLLIDNDKQGNTSKFFGVHSYDAPSISEVLTIKDYPISRVVRKTKYKNLDVVPANMTLLKANKEILIDSSRSQQTRLQKALRGTIDYDFVIIDNAPDLSMHVINALVASQDIIIPIKIDRFALDGIEQLVEQIDDVKDWNPDVRIAGCVITMYQKNNVNVQGEELMRTNFALPVFESVIQKTVKIDETTFVGKPILEYDGKCTAARGYIALVDEYLKNCANN